MDHVTLLKWLPLLFKIRKEGDLLSIPYILKQMSAFSWFENDRET